MKEAVIVLGMHRSGTSALTGALHLLGAATPTCLMEANEFNERGYFESTAVMELNDAVLASAGSSWADWRPLNPRWFKSAAAKDYRSRAASTIREEFNGAPLIALKDPRNCRITPFWSGALEEAGYLSHALIVIRNPLEVALSLSRVHGISVPHGLLLWLRYVIDAESNSRKLPRSIVTWSDLLDDWRVVLDRVSVDMGLEWPRRSDFSAHEIDAFFSPTLQHYKVNDNKFKLRSEINEWVKLTYDAMTTLSSDINSNSAIDTLDNVRLDFDRYSNIFGPVLVNLENEINRLKIAVRESTLAAAQRDNALARSNELEMLVESLQAQFGEVNAKCLGLEDLHQAAASALQESADRAEWDLRQAHEEFAARESRLTEEILEIRAAATAQNEHTTLIEAELDAVRTNFWAKESAIGTQLALTEVALDDERQRAIRIDAELELARAGFAAGEAALAAQLSAAGAEAAAEHGLAARLEENLASVLAQSIAREAANRAELDALNSDREAILNSASWKLAMTFSGVARHMPARVRHYAANLIRSRAPSS